MSRGRRSGVRERIRRTLAGVPFLPVSLGALAGVAAAEAGWAGRVAVFAAAVVIVLALRRRWWPAWGFGLLACFALLHGHRLELRDRASDWVVLQGRTIVELEGVVVGLREWEGVLPRAMVRIAGGRDCPADLRGRILAVRGLGPEWRPGDRIRLEGRVYLPTEARNPGEFDRRGWLLGQGAVGAMRTLTRERAGPPDARLWPRRLAWNLRQSLRERIVRGIDADAPEASLIRGLVLGDRAGGGEELYGVFRESGTMHVFAVSGLHVGLVGLLGWMVMNCCRVPRQWGLWGVLLLMWTYALVTGLRPPALRASLMASVFLLAFAVRRRPSLANGLLASLPLVLLLDSFQLRQVGFQLSYTVVGMIIVLAPLLYRSLRVLVEADPFLPRVLYSRTLRWSVAVREKVGGLFAVSLAAWVGSVPLIGFHFDMVTPVAVVASMVLIPVVFAILAIALGGVMVGLVSPSLEVATNRLNQSLAHGSYLVAREFSELPGSHLELGRHRGWSNGIVVFDLWGGDGAIYCGAGDGTLIDAGSAESYDQVVGPALREAGRSPASLVLTHPDGGHAGGLAPALYEARSRQLLLPVREAGSPAFRALTDAAEGTGCRIHLARPGERYPLGEGAELEVVWAPPPGSGRRADDRGLVLRLHWQGWRILITGDAGFETEKELLARSIDVRSDVWVMGMHATDFTGTPAFVRAVRPEVIVASGDLFPETERLPAWWGPMVEEFGIALWRQSSCGAVLMEPGEDALVLKSFLPSERVRLPRGGPAGTR